MPARKNLNQTLVIVGAGAFGSWIALLAQRQGYQVTLVDKRGPANELSSSTGESRIIRSAYGSDEIYTAMAQQSLSAWKELFSAEGHPGCFRETGVLWIAKAAEPSVHEAQVIFDKLAIPHELLTHDMLARRFQQMRIAADSVALFELGAGALLAERSSETVFGAAIREGVRYQEATIAPPISEAGSIQWIETASGQRIYADAFIFAAGSWLPKLFPAVLGNVIRPTRQVLFFFDVAERSLDFGPQAFPCWVDESDANIAYGIPDLGNGLKLGFHQLGPPFDPDHGDRDVAPSLASQATDYLRSRFQGISSARLRSTRVCHYENTPFGDFLIDRHPAIENVWLCGGGSGHGFKHAPAVAEYLLGQLNDSKRPELRFALRVDQSTSRKRVL